MIYLFIAGNWITSTFIQGLLSICLFSDYMLYHVVDKLYHVFVVIGKAQFFTSNTIKPYMDKIYLLIGIVSLFLAAYTLLSLIINPDNVSKGQTSPAGLIKNVVIAILALAFIPTIFNFAYHAQESIIDYGVIPKMFQSHSGSASNNFSLSDHTYSQFAITVFESSFYAIEGTKDYEKANECITNAGGKATDGKVVHEITNILSYGECLKYVAQDEPAIRYNFFLSSVVGIVIIYVFLTYCIDIAIRTIKLGLLQLMAPLPAVLMVIPGQDKVFKSWVKETIKTFLSLFLKIFILMFGVYMVKMVRDWFGSENYKAAFGNAPQDVVNFAKLFIFLGIILSIKRVPKLFKDVFGLDLAENSFSLKKHVDEVKEAIAPVTNFASKSIGMAAGAIAANQAYNQGLQHGNEGSKLKRGLATFHGMRNGWNGGISNIGKAYDYELEVQKTYGRHQGESDGKQVMAGIGNALRDNFGFGSRYDYMVKEAELERDIRNSPREISMRNLGNASREETARINNSHKPYLDYNQEIFDLASKEKEIALDECSKDNSKEKLNRQNLLSNGYYMSKDNTFKAEYNGKSYNASELYSMRQELSAQKAAAKTPEEISQLQKEIHNLNNAITNYSNSFNEYADLVNGMNIKSLDAYLKSVQDDPNRSKEDKIQMEQFVSFAKDAIVNQYRNKDEADQSTSYVTVVKKMKELANIADSNATTSKLGIQTKKNKDGLAETDSNGNVKEDASLKKDIIDMIRQENGKSIADLKKTVGQLLDKEKMAVDLELTQGKITQDVIYYDENGKQQNAKGLSYYEVGKLIEQIKHLYEEENKKLEKLRESVESEKQDAESRKSLKQQSDSLKSTFKHK